MAQSDPDAVLATSPVLSTIPRWARVALVLAGVASYCSAVGFGAPGWGQAAALLGFLLLAAVMLAGTAQELLSLHRDLTTLADASAREQYSKRILDAELVVSLILFAVGAALYVGFGPRAYLASFLEAEVLIFSSVLVYLTAVYAVTSYSASVDKSANVTREAVGASAEAIVGAVQGLHPIVQSVGTQVTDAVHALAEATNAAAAATVKRAQELREAEAKEAADRIDAARPKLAARLEVRGGVLHHVYLKVRNTGPDAFSLAMNTDFGGITRTGTAARLMKDSGVEFDLGDVGNVPLTAAVTARCSALDSLGNLSQFDAKFTYLRTTGFWGQTTGWAIGPAGIQEMRRS